MRVKAAVLRTVGAPPPYATSRPLDIIEVELAPPGRGEVLVRLKATGLCHSDLSVMNGDRPRPVPMVLGHESAGIVVALGAGVEGLAVGDHVVTAFVPSCGHCGPCVAHRPALCEPGFAVNSAGTLLSGERRWSDGEIALHHHLGISGFADHAVMAAESLVRIAPDLPWDIAAVFGCAVLTGVGAVVNTAQVQAHHSVAVVGLGGVGLAALLGARALGAREILAVDLHQDKLELAAHLGATRTFNASDPDCAEALRAATGGGVDFAFEMAGSVRALDLAWNITRRGGTSVTAGLAPPTAQFTLSPVKLVAEERTLKGSYIGSCVPQRDIPKFIQWYREGRLPVDALLAERLRLDDLNEGFDRLATGHTTRQVVLFD